MASPRPIVGIFCIISSINFQGMLVGLLQAIPTHPDLLYTEGILPSFLCSSTFPPPSFQFSSCRLVPLSFQRLIWRSNTDWSISNEEEKIRRQQETPSKVKCDQWAFRGKGGWASAGWKEGSSSSAVMPKPPVLLLSLVIRILALKWGVEMHFLW